MPSVFLGLNIALRTMQASQQGLETTSHNIANANTPGYSRQEALMAATRPYTVPTLGGYPSAGQVGTGVEVILMQRYRDAFMDLQVRLETQGLNLAIAERETLRQIEMVLPEPSDTGLSKLLERFWNAWSDLSNEPQELAFRSVVRQQASNLCSALNNAYQQLDDLQHNLDRQIGLKVQEINKIGEQIAALNMEIQKVQITGNRPNDLIDQRDVLLDRLAVLTDMSYRESENGVVSVYIGGTALVFDFNAYQLVAGLDGEIRWAADPPGAPSVTISGGELGGILRGKDAVMAKKDELDQLANALREAVNSVHRQGVGLNNSTGIAFFVGHGAYDIALSDEILADLENIAAANSTDSPGDGSCATAIAALRSETLAGLGATAGEFHSALIAQLGADTKALDDMATNLDALVQHLERQRDTVSGVSLDEEAANLIRYERAYQAAARVMTAMDEMLDRLINGTGLVGL